MKNTHSLQNLHKREIDKQPLLYATVGRRENFITPCKALQKQENGAHHGTWQAKTMNLKSCTTSSSCVKRGPKSPHVINLQRKKRDLKENAKSY